ncbi:LysR family transcriptional regulator [Siminovitchia sp. FSL H7-0308]|uniref:LysR family transcriptional regulator n=1 Tax=Siminovitchia sp. FSL H7-0308 TaxID=2921432 RepID=UPI0030ED0EEA
MIETRHLVYFKTVAEHLNFTKAAKHLNISQPPLSYQIKQLEELLGVPLFHRTNRKVELTDAGKYFYEVTIKTLHNLDNHIDHVRKIGKGEIGSLRIGFGGSVIYDILPKIIRSIRQRYSELKLTVQQLTTFQQVNALKNGEIDIGILVPPINEESINILPIRKEEFIVCLNKNHPLSSRKEPLAVQLFSNEDVIMTPHYAGIGYYESVINLCKRGGFTPHVAQTAQEQLTIVSLVASGLGVAFVPLSTANIYHENVVYRTLQEKVYKETAIAWNKGDVTPSVELFLTFMKEQMNSNGKSI